VLSGVTGQAPRPQAAAVGQTGVSARPATTPQAAPHVAAAAAAPAPKTAPPAVPAAPVAAAPAATGEPAIVLADGSKLAAASDKPMLSFLADGGAATDDSGSIGGKVQTLWECWDQNDPSDTGGSCGKCVVTVLDGMTNLSEASSKEKNTIKKANKKMGGKLDEAKCRLACQAVVKGPVKIQPTGKTDG
jgi:hypothetical protein